MIPADLRKKGKIVLVGGVFDIIHPGHIYFLQKARKLGSSLIVIVARDSTATNIKRAPIIPENQRLEVVQSLKPVDLAVLGYEDKDFIEIVKDIRPDIIVVGPNQIHNMDDLKVNLKKAGLSATVKKVDKMKLGALYSTKWIIQRIKDLH